MDRDTFALYNTLGVEKSASGDDIKRAYKRLALRYHPDKNPGATEEYIKIVHAYEILSDTRKRSVYDNYGEFGVSALDTPMGQLFDPEVGGMLCLLFSLLALLIVALIVFFSLLSLRIDGVIEWKFVVVFIPLWILDIIVVLVLGKRVQMVLSPKLDETLDREISSDDEDYDDRDVGENSTDRSERRNARKASRKQAVKLFTRVRTVLNMIYALLIVAFGILIALKADGMVTFSAVLVFSPYFIVEGLNFLPALVDCFLRIRQARASLDKITIAAVLKTLFSVFWLWTLRNVQAVLIAMRIDNIITADWNIVFIPLYLVGVKYAIQLILAYRKYDRMVEQRELASQGKTMVIAGMVLFVVVATLAYAVVGLVARKLNGYVTIPMSSVLVPIFVLLAIFLCCFGCCIPLILIGGRNLGGFEDGAEVSLVDPNRRITDNVAGTLVV
jgi:curved DNA-binding protein CbpA